MRQTTRHATGAGQRRQGGWSRRHMLGSMGAAGLAYSFGIPRLRAQQAGPVLRVGVMGPFTGPAARTGDAFQQGVIMALEDARAAGEVPVTIDGVQRDIEIVWVDSESSPERAVRAFTDAVTRQGVEFMVTGWHSSVAMAMMDAVADYGLVHVGHQGESQYISEKINQDPERYRGWFKGWPSPPIFAGLYGEPLNYFIEQGLWTPATRRAAVMVEDTDFGRGWGEALVESLRENGFEVDGYDVTALDETEFSPLLTRYRAQEVSLVGMTTTGSVGASNFVKQFRDLAVPALLLGHGLTWFAEWHELTGDASDYVVTMDSARAIAPWQFEWIERYQARWDEYPSITPAGQPYDYMRMAIKVLNAAGTLDFDTLVETIYDTPHEGVWHKYLFSREPGPHAMAPNEVMTGSFMEGFLFPMVQLMGGEAKVLWPLEFAEAEFQQPPWIG